MLALLKTLLARTPNLSAESGWRSGNFLFEQNLKRVSVYIVSIYTMAKPDPKDKQNRSAKLTPEQIERVQMLTKNGVSLRGVAKITRISFSTVHTHAKQFSKQQSSIDFSIYSKRELGYIIGFFAGDGSKIDEKTSGHYGAKFTLDAKTDVDITSFLKQLFEKGGKRVTLYQENSWLTMKVYSKRLLKFLQSFIQYQENQGKTLKMLVNTTSWSKDFSLGFIGGLIDADGHVLKDKRKKGHFGAVITTSNPVLVQQLATILRDMGLKLKVAEAQPYKASFSKKPTYYIRLGKEEFTKVCNDLICIKHERVGCNAKRF